MKKDLVRYPLFHKSEIEHPLHSLAAVCQDAALLSHFVQSLKYKSKTQTWAHILLVQPLLPSLWDSQSWGSSDSRSDMACPVPMI